MKRFSIVAAILLILTAASCKKDDTNTTPTKPVVMDTTGCNILTAQTDGAHKYTFEYNSNDQMTKEMQDGSSFVLVTYHGDTVIETTQSAITAYVRNSTGQTIAALQTASDGTRYNQFYHYDANGYIVQYITQPQDVNGNLIAGDTVNIINTIANGNLIESKYTKTDGTQVGDITRSPDLTKNNNLPNSRSYVPSELEAGPSKNLLLNVHSSLPTDFKASSYKYEFDSKGRITKRVESINSINYGSSIDSMVYTYKCN